VTRDRLPAMAAVLARAFADDPMIRWPLLPAGEDLGVRIEQTFGSIYDGIVDLGLIWEAGDGDGFAVWIAPGMADQMFESDAAARSLVAPLTDDDAARYDVLWSWIETHTPDDVWYLDVLGVDPAKQGMGIGSALIRFGLERAASDGVDAFLETAVEANVAYYERFGFRTVVDGRASEEAPHIWFMRTGG
jgi:ribosomal protein S18 acetylase RimI-like enzyme